MIVSRMRVPWILLIAWSYTCACVRCEENSSSNYAWEGGAWRAMKEMGRGEKLPLVRGAIWRDGLPAVARDLFTIIVAAFFPRIPCYLPDHYAPLFISLYSRGAYDHYTALSSSGFDGARQRKVNFVPSYTTSSSLL